jgi:hypothetical protein
MLSGYHRPKKEPDMSVPWISVDDTFSRVKSGQALLVCAYDSDAKFVMNHLAGAISYGEFSQKFAIAAKDREIIFYCA